MWRGSRGCHSHDVELREEMIADISKATNKAIDALQMDTDELRVHWQWHRSRFENAAQVLRRSNALHQCNVAAAASRY